MNEVLPFPWNTLRRLQAVTDSTIVNARTNGREEALCLLVEELALGKIPSSAEAMERRYRTLSSNRAVKYRNRKSLAEQVAYELQAKHAEQDPAELMTVRQVTAVVLERVEQEEWELLQLLSEEATYSEVAGKLTVPIGTLKARVSRLRHRLRAIQLAGVRAAY